MLFLVFKSFETTIDEGLLLDCTQVFNGNKIQKRKKKIIKQRGMQTRATEKF